jgi:hypothetical protein
MPRYFAFRRTQPSQALAIATIRSTPSLHASFNAKTGELLDEIAASDTSAKLVTLRRCRHATAANGCNNRVWTTKIAGDFTLVVEVSPVECITVCLGSRH